MNINDVARDPPDGDDATEIYDSLLGERERSKKLFNAVSQTFEPYIKKNEGFVVLTQATRLGADGTPRGFVARVSGTAPLTSRANPFVNARTGRGVSWFPIEPVMDVPALRESVDATRSSRSPSTRSMSVYVSKSPNQLESPEFFVAVHGNDAAVNDELLDWLEASPSRTLGEVAESPQYARLIESSASARAALAAQFARLHGLVMRKSEEGEITEGSIQSHAIVEPRNAQNPNADESVYDVYDDTVNPTNAHNGVPVFTGALAGFELLRGPASTMASGLPSRAIHPLASGNEKLTYGDVPLLHANTGEHDRDGERLAALHQSNDDGDGRLRERASASLHSLGAVPDVNPAIERRYNAFADDTAMQAFSQLGIALNGSAAVDRRTLHTLVAELPGIDTVNMSLSELATIAKKTRVKRLPVRVHGDVVAALQRNWPAVRGAQNDYKQLSKALSKERDDDTVALSRELVRTLANIVSDEDKNE